MMKDELLKLISAVKAKRGWSDSALENRFGSPKLINTISAGRRGPSLNTAYRFKAWLEAQLSEEAA